MSPYLSHPLLHRLHVQTKLSTELPANYGQQ